MHTPSFTLRDYCIYPEITHHTSCRIRHQRHHQIFNSDTSSDSFFETTSLSDHSSLDLTSVLLRGHLANKNFISVRADLIPSPKRVKDSGYLADVEVDPKEISLRDDTVVRVSDEPHLEQDSDPEIQAEINDCIAYALLADLMREQYEATYETLEIWFRVPDHTQAYPCLSVSMRLRGTASVEVSESLTRLHAAAMSPYAERVEGRCDDFDFMTMCGSSGKMPCTQSGASWTVRSLKNWLPRRVAEEMEAVKSPGP
ncbi:hypothetical protein Tco_1522996 [Tanacetum coccineum]